MKNFALISFFIFSVIFNIKCYYIPCSKQTDGKPSSKYHCSGLNITDAGDKYCCLWRFLDEQTNKTIERCSSISENQYHDLHNYIIKKTINYKDLEIECSGDQTLYCSNILFDQENIDDCGKLPVSDKKDKYCCRWSFTDNTNNGKLNRYCASLSDYQFQTIVDYIQYKEDNGKGRYHDLSIECSDIFINISSALYILLFISLIV